MERNSLSDTSVTLELPQYKYVVAMATRQVDFTTPDAKYEVDRSKGLEIIWNWNFASFGGRMPDNFL